MRNIANAAQVSPTTVRMVIYNNPGVGPETAQRVWATIADSGYKVKPIANGDDGESVGLLIEQKSMPVISDVFYNYDRPHVSPDEKTTYEVMRYLLQ